jgi:hypothetical protein
MLTMMMVMMNVITHAELPQLPRPFLAFLQAKLQSLHASCGEVAMIVAELGWLTATRLGVAAPRRCRVRLF